MVQKSVATEVISTPYSLRFEPTACRSTSMRLATSASARLAWGTAPSVRGTQPSEKERQQAAVC